MSNLTGKIDLFFSNTFSDWYETFYEIVSEIESNYNDEFGYKYSKVDSIVNSQGRGGLWELAKELTDKFEEEYKDETWEENEFLEEINTFLIRELYEQT